MLQEYHRRRKDEKEDESDTDEEEHAAVMAAVRPDGEQRCSDTGTETLTETPTAGSTPQTHNRLQIPDRRLATAARRARRDRVMLSFYRIPDYFCTKTRI